MTKKRGDKTKKTTKRKRSKKKSSFQFDEKLESYTKENLKIGFTVGDLKKLRDKNGLPKSLTTKEKIAVELVALVERKSMIVDTEGTTVLIGKKRKIEDLENSEENEQPRKKQKIDYSVFETENNQVKKGELSIKTPFWAMIYDEDNLNRIFGVVLVHQICNVDENSVYLKRSELFPSQFLPKYQSIEEFKNNQPFANFFYEANTDLTKGEATGDWELNELVPITPTNIQYLQQLFILNRKEHVYNQINQHLKTRNDLSSINSKFSIPSEGLVIPKEGRIVEKVKKRRRRNWTFHEECTLIELVEKNGKSKWGRLLEDMQTGKHLLCNEEVEADALRLKYGRLVENWLKKKQSYERKPFVPPIDTINQDSLNLLERKHVENEIENEKRMKDCVSILIKLESSELTLSSEKNYSEEQLRKMIIEGDKERKKIREDRVEKLANRVSKSLKLQENSNKIKENLGNILQKNNEINQKDLDQKIQFQSNELDLEKRLVELKEEKLKIFKFQTLCNIFSKDPKYRFNKKKCGEACGICNDLSIYGVEEVQTNLN